VTDPDAESATQLMAAVRGRRSVWRLPSTGSHPAPPSRSPMVERVQKPERHLARGRSTDAAPDGHAHIRAWHETPLHRSRECTCEEAAPQALLP